MKDKGKYTKIFYALIVFVSLFKCRVHILETDIDSSWIYAINQFFHEGVLWGHDVMFTYGPLGFMFSPMNIGSNILISFVFGILIALSAGLILSYALFSERQPVSTHSDNILLSLTLFYLGNCVIGRLGYSEVTTYIMLCLLSLCWHSDEFKFFFMASLLCAFSMFLKFNSGAVDFMTLITFALFFKPAKYLPALIITPVLFFIFFMAYNPSLSELAYYIRGAYEISSGYISAMSTSFFQSKSFAVMMSAMLLVYSALLIIILSAGNFFGVNHSLRYAMIFAMPLFGLFRHAFTRSGEGHNFLFMPALYIWLSVYVLFMNKELHMKQAVSKFLKSCLCVIFIASFILSLTGFNKAGYWPKMAIYHASTNPFFEFRDNIRTFIPPPEDGREVKLPSDFLNAISGDTTAIYPFEISFAQDIPNYKSMPVIQAYSAYTSWLDEQNAEFFADKNAPKFIIFRTEAIDERFSLLECPLTWLEIFRHYDMKLYGPDAKLFLLEHRESSSERRFKSHEIITKTYSHDEKIIIPETGNICLMKMNMNLNLMGKFMKTFYKIPDVLMTAEFEDGRIITKRVLPEVLKNDTLISHIIHDDNDFAHFMRGDMSAGKVKSIQFTGDGMKYYSSEISISLRELEL